MPDKKRQKTYFDDIDCIGTVVVRETLAVTGKTTLAGGVERSIAAATATADGLTTGLLTFVMGFVTVTSSAATKIVTLPACVAGDAGKVIEGLVTANGCEFRTPATGNATINNVDADGGTYEAACPATSSFKAKCTGADEWILEVYDALGARTIPVPDAV